MRPSWDNYFLEIADVVSKRSTCARRSVGCVLVDNQHQIVATGYNGTSRGTVNCIDQPCEAAKKAGSGSPDADGCLAIHAETNAFLQLAGKTFQGPLTLYTQVTPCFTCAKNICNSAVKRIVVKGWYNHRQVLELFESAKIELEIVP